jgi:hypothetical protein
VLGNLLEEKIPDEDLARFIVKSKVDEYLLEERLHYWGIMKAPFLSVGGYDFTTGYIDNLSKVTPDDIMAAANEYISELEYVAIAVIPEA